MFYLFLSQGTHWEWRRKLYRLSEMDLNAEGSFLPKLSGIWSFRYVPCWQCAPFSLTMISQNSENFFFSRGPCLYDPEFTFNQLLKPCVYVEDLNLKWHIKLDAQLREIISKRNGFLETHDEVSRLIIGEILTQPRQLVFSSSSAT